MTVLEKWIEALESGYYQQGAGWLCSGGRFCCLGVLCDVAGLPYEVHGGVRVYEGMYETFLSKSMRKVVGLTHSQQVYLSERNDNGMSFKEIAALLRTGEILGQKLESGVGCGSPVGEVSAGDKGPAEG